jgi:PAS domain S-box-containing protein
MDKLASVSLRNRRPTIGYLVAGTTNAYQAAVLAGLIEGAQERGANLISFAGGQLHRTPNDPFAHLRNAVYDLVTANSVDGLVINSTLGNYATVEELRDFCAHYRSLPTVCIGEAIPGTVSILVDNDRGMRQVIAHLIERHGYRRIAFIQGPTDNDEAEQRYRVYTAVLAEFGLALDPDLVAAGDFFFDSGAEAIRLLLDERQVDLQAIVAANDDMALGALEALQTRGMRVPDDVAIVGFDDVIDAKAVTPSLTTVRQPLSEQGKQAAEKLLALLVGEAVPEEMVLPTELVIRRSCGCLDPAVVQAAAGAKTRSSEPLQVDVDAQQDHVLSEMTQAMGTYGGRPSPEWGTQLWKAFSAELAGHSPGVFLLALDDVLRQVATAGGDVAALQGAVSALRRHILPRLNGEALQRAEDLWQQARVVIGLVAQQRQAHQNLQAERRMDRLRRIEAALLTTFDVDGLINTLAEGLPRLGIPSCYLALYEDSQPCEYLHPAEWSRLMLAYTEKGRVKLESGGRRFRSHELVPEDMRPQGRPFTFSVESLCFQKDQLGFVIFEVGPREGFTSDALRRLISSALQGALLVQRVRERSAELARQQYILDTFMETVPDCIYFKDLNSRFTRTNRSHALRMGVSDPAEEIGKSDFDFFSEEQARIRHEQEQEIIRTGQPTLNAEEIDDQGRWTLATKMPLRDEHGNIIGTFGISRDITERKQAEEALERRAAQLALLNEVGRKIATILDLESVLNTAAHLMQEGFGYHHVGLFTVDRERGELVMRARAGQFAHLFPSDHRIKLGQGLVGWVGDYGARLLAGDVNVESRYTNFYPDLIPTGSELGVPIRVGEETVGVLDVQSPQLNAFDQNDVMVMEILADQIAVAIENARLYEAVQRELAERRRAEDQLRRSSAELVQSNEELKRFTYIVSHDLRAPLVNLKGFAGELASSLQVIRPLFESLSPHLDEKQRSVVATAFQADLPEALGFIDASVTRMEHFINALLTLSRLGRRELNLERINMEALIQTTLETLAHQIEQRQVQVTVGVLPEVVADRTAMEQITGNILNNAIIYLDPGRSGEIEITGERNTRETIFRIRDNGRGIAPEDMDKVFAPFRRAGKQDVPGEGMGLAYVQTLVRRHRGQIWCESEPGIGTTFTFTISHQFTQGDPHD